jgi:uncharacterized membrane protein YraQ (UPF0718 family)
VILAVLDAGRLAGGVGHGLREALAMVVDTFWALVVGFTLSGAVQAFVSRDEMRSRLGGHGPVEVVRASLYGMASSSCSYAASAMARSMVARGADFLAAMVFMFASTNLVVELGIALVVLIGWQFAVAEFVGGIVMIGLLVAVGSLWWRGKVLTEATRIAEAATSLRVGAGRSAAAGPGAGADGGCSRSTGCGCGAGCGCDGCVRGGGPGAGDGPDGGGDGGGGSDRGPWRQRIRSTAGWSDAAGYTMSDLTMLRKELVVGFVAAGFIAALVPVHAWNDVFVHGHGTWTTLENVAVGPLVAVVSFVCSVGNIPLAAALWQGGISFGGVVSFVFADLITLPLLLVYRKQYGPRMAVRMLGTFWVVMSVAGLVTQYLFSALGLLPSTRHTVVVGRALRVDATTVADLVALGAVAGLWWLHRHRDRFGGGSGYAQDPVCGMQVETRQAPATLERDGATVYFCSEHCAEQFARRPGRYAADAAGT